jgi:hypothetical protein
LVHEQPTTDRVVLSWIAAEISWAGPRPLPLVSGPGAEAVVRAGLALRAQVVADYLAVVIPIAVLVSR